MTINKSNEVRGVIFIEIIAIAIAVNDGKSPRFTSARSRIIIAKLTKVVSGVCIVSSKELCAVVQNILIVVFQNLDCHRLCLLSQSVLMPKTEKILARTTRLIRSEE